MGSALTGAAAIQTHRNFIGIEREQKYFALAKSNIERVKHDLSNQA
jgi:DNA modification methylase